MNNLLFLLITFFLIFLICYIMEQESKYKYNNLKKYRRISKKN